MREALLGTCVREQVNYVCVYINSLCTRQLYVCIARTCSYVLACVCYVSHLCDDKW